MYYNAFNECCKWSKTLKTYTIMIKYYKTENIDPSPQVIDICVNDKEYSCFIEHTSVESGIGSQLYRPHMHDIYHIVLYLDGEGQIFWKDQMVNIRKGALFLCSPGINHHFYPNKKRPFKYIELTFSMKAKDNQLLKVPFSSVFSNYSGINLTAINFPLQLNARQMWQVEQCFSEIFKNLNSSKQLHWFLVYTAIAKLFGFLIEEIYVGEDLGEKSSIDIAKNYIDQNFHKNRSIEYISKKGGMSKGHFQRQFKKKFGLSPIAYQNQVRVDVAKRLLVETSLNISEISERIGLENPHYFSRLFKNTCGMSPKKYRNEF
jgi:AraC-like DNA-binding protein/mannose-6-phosphate isomerase-like protein (cupin superfamily)